MKCISGFLIGLLLCTATLAEAQDIMVGAGLKFASGDVRMQHVAGLGSPGYGAGLALVLPIQDKLNVIAGTGMYFVSEEAVSEHARLIPLTLGVRMGFGAGGFLPYVGLRGGICFVRFHSAVRRGTSVDERQGMFCPSFGFVLPVTSKMYWDFSVDYDFLFSSPQRNEFFGLNISLGIGL